MLIVIVIIGVLAAALIPRLTSARWRANDVARKASLQQIATALVSYQIDKGKFPTTGGKLTSISGELTAGWLSSIPTDPNTAREFSGVANILINDWEFGYTPIHKNGQPANGFVLMAGTDTEAWANWVYTGEDINDDSDYSSIILCKSINKGATNANNNGVCTYQSTGDYLRYIVLY